jgi:hypothetical protein
VAVAVVLDLFPVMEDLEVAAVLLILMLVDLVDLAVAVEEVFKVV